MATLGLGLLVLGSLIGTLVSGHMTDLLLRRGFLTARVSVPAVCYLGAASLLIPGILIQTFTPAVWFDIGGMALIAAANPPLDAARLDIMPAGLWGRAESTRTVARSLVQALAPLAFGGLADLIAGIVPQQSPVGTHPGLVSQSTATGLKFAFLTMLAALATAGILLARARRTYPVDVATAAACNQGLTL
jgi:MFS family permease